MQPLHYTAKKITCPVRNNILRRTAEEGEERERREEKNRAEDEEAPNIEEEEFQREPLQA